MSEEIYGTSITNSVQVSGFGCQASAPNSTRSVGVAHVMDFLSAVLAFSCNPIRVQLSGCCIY